MPSLYSNVKPEIKMISSKTVEESETWREAKKELIQARSDYGAVVLDKALVCG